MSKPYKESDLSAHLVEDRTWRIKEVSDLKSAIVRSDALSQKVLLRALVTICYAHWEGYVRFAAKRYMEHIALRKFTLGQLERQFTRNHFSRRIAALATQKTSFFERARLVDEILDSAEQRFARVDEDLVSTRSNLNFEVFSELCTVCGVPSGEFAGDEAFVDVFLLKRRNAIAHGEDTFVSLNDLGPLAERTVELMRRFGDALENQMYLKKYRAAS